MVVRIVTALGILIPLLGARIVRGDETPWWVVLFVAVFAFGTGRLVERLLASGQTKRNQRLGWALMLGACAASSLYVILGSSEGLAKKIDHWGLLDAGPAPAAPPWEHHAGAWSDVAVGSGGACGLARGDGAIRCWGDPKYGWPEKETAVALSGRAEQVSIGAFGACARIAGGHVECWRASQIATQTQERIAIERVTDLAVGFGHACAIDVVGDVWCWGTILEAIPSPRRIAGIAKAKRIASGHEVSCAIAEAGGVWCWGLTSFDRPDQPRTPTPIPTRIDGVPPASEIAIGPGTACAVGDGQLWCWGHAIASSKTPVRMPGFSDVAKVSIGPRHLCAALRSQHVRCTGKNDQGQLGLGDLRDAGFNAVAGLSDITAIAAGEHATCAVDSSADGELVCWGTRR